MPATILLKAFGYTTDDLLRMYYPVEEIHVQKGKLWRKLDPEVHAGLRVPYDLLEKGSKEPIVREGSKLTKATIARLKAAGIKESEVNPEDLVGHTVLVDLVDSATKEKILEKNHKLTAEVLKKVLASKIQGRGYGRDLQAASSGGNALHRDGARAVREPLLQSQALRSLPGRPAQTEQEARA
jgi:DNA-directed RNA polymerase subunit beta